MKNIVLIGMPSCGKTTIGKMLSVRSGLPFTDTDEEIVKRENRSIPEIFAKDGENYFRTVESQVVQECSKKRGKIISCGGGVVLRRQNVDALKKNGVLFYLIRPIELLSTEGRPLSKDFETLKEMEKVRAPLYRESADYIIDNDKTPMDAVKEIERYL